MGKPLTRVLLMPQSVMFPLKEFRLAAENFDEVEHTRAAAMLHVWRSGAVTGMPAPRCFNLRTENDVIVEQFSPELWDSGSASVNMWEREWRRSSESCRLFAPRCLPELRLWRLAPHAAATGYNPWMCRHVSCGVAGLSKNSVTSNISASEGYSSSYVFTKDVFTI